MLHLLVFCDEYKQHENTEDNYGLVTMTIGEVHHGLRAHLHSPAIAPLMVFDRNMRENAGYDDLAAYITTSFRAAAHGVRIWSHHHRREVHVIALPHLILLVMDPDELPSVSYV